MGREALEYLQAVPIDEWMKLDLYDPAFRGFGVAVGASIGAALVGAGFLTSVVVGVAAFAFVAGVMTLMQSIVKDPGE